MGSFEVACLCLKGVLLTVILNRISQTRPSFSFFLLSPPLTLILHPLYQMSHGSCLFHGLFAKWVLEYDISTCSRVELCFL